MPSSAEAATTWLHPKKILHHCHPHYLKNQELSSSECQRWAELRVAALASILLKMLFEHLKDEQHVLRSALRPQDAADVQVSAIREVNGKLFLFPYEEEMEVVEYTHHSHKESISQFLQRTKLAPHKRYQAKTVIVCHLSSLESHEVSWQTVHEELCEFLSNQNDPLHATYTVTLICPENFGSMLYRGAVVYPYLKVSEPIALLNSQLYPVSEVRQNQFYRAPKGLGATVNLITNN